MPFSRKTPRGFPPTAFLHQTRHIHSGGRSPFIPSSAKGVATSSRVLQHSDGSSRFDSAGGHSARLAADAGQLKSSALQGRGAHARVEQQRATFEPLVRQRLPASNKNNCESTIPPTSAIRGTSPSYTPILSHQATTVMITLPRPPGMVRLETSSETLDAFMDNLYSEYPPLHRFAAASGSARRFEDGIQLAVAPLISAQLPACDPQEASHTFTVYHLFFNSLIPLLPLSGASSQVVTLGSMDVLLGYAWTGLATSYAGTVGCVVPHKYMDAWRTIRRAIYRCHGISVDDVKESTCEQGIRALLDLFVGHIRHESGYISLFRKDSRPVIGELLRRFTSKAPSSCDHTRLTSVLADEAMVALYISPLVVSQKNGVMGLAALCDHLLGAFDRSGTPFTSDAKLLLRSAVHRAVSQRSDIFALVPDKSGQNSIVKIKVRVQNAGLSLTSPSGFSLVGLGIRIALFHSILPTAHRYCRFIDGVKTRNGPSVAPVQTGDDWDSIDIGTAKSPGSSQSVSEDDISCDFDAFALSQFAAKGYVSPSSVGMIGAPHSPLLASIIGVFMERVPSDSALGMLRSLLPIDKASTALASTLVAAANPSHGELLTLCMSDVRLVLLRWLLVGVSVEYVIGVRQTCGIYTANVLAANPNAPFALVKAMREAVVSETTLGMRLCCAKVNAPSSIRTTSGPNVGLAECGVLQADDGAGAQEEASQSSMEYIEASAILELDADDYTESVHKSGGSGFPEPGSNPNKKMVPNSLRRIIEYNAGLEDVEVAERVRITLRKASWTSEGVTLTNTLPLSVLARAIIWNSYARTTTRNLRRFLGYFPEHFELFVVGEKDLWVRMAPNAPAGGPIVPPLQSDIPIIPHGTDHPRAQIPQPPRLKQGDIATFARIVTYLRPLVQLQILSAMSVLPKPSSSVPPGSAALEIPIEVYSQIGVEDRAIGRVTLGFTVREIAEIIGANVKRLCQSLFALPPNLVTLVPTLSIAEEDNSGDSLTTLLEQRDENSVVILGQNFYSLEFMRFQILPLGVVEGAKTNGTQLWRKMHKLPSEASPSSIPHWDSLCEDGSPWRPVPPTELVSRAPRFLFDSVLSPFFSAKLDSQSYASSLKYVSSALKEKVDSIPLLEGMRPVVIGCMDTRALELMIGWREQALHRSSKLSALAPISLERRLGGHGFQALIESVVANPTSVDEVKAFLSQSGSHVTRYIPPLRSLLLDRTSSGNLIVVIAEQRLPDGDAGALDATRPITSAPPSRLDLAMAELFKKRVDRRLAALPKIPLGSVQATLDGTAGFLPEAVLMHNQSHAGLPRFSSPAKSVAPPPSPPSKVMPSPPRPSVPPSPLSAPPPFSNPSALPPPPVGVSASSSYYFGAQTFTHLLAEAKRRCIPHRRYFEPLIQFIADTAFAIFQVVLPALDVQGSGGSNRMERFALVSGYAGKCQHKVGTIESFIAYWDGLFVEAMGLVSNLPEHRGVGYVREFKGRVTRRMLYSRFFLPLLADVTAVVDVKETSHPPPRAGGPPPPLGGSSMKHQGMGPVPPSQQGIGVDEVAAACQYEYLFEARFGPLSALLLDFGDFRLQPVGAQPDHNLNSRSDCFVSPNASTAVQHVEYRAIFVPPTAECLGSSLAEFDESMRLLEFVQSLRSIGPPSPAGAPTLNVPIDPLMRHIAGMPSVKLRELFKACITLLPSAARVLSQYVDAAASGNAVPTPSFQMVRQFLEGIVALYPLHLRLNFGSNGPTGMSVALPGAHIPTTWADYYRSTIQPAIAPAVWQALRSEGVGKLLVSLSDVEQVVSWRRDPAKPFPALPLSKSPANRDATVPLLPLLSRLAEEWHSSQGGLTPSGVGCTGGKPHCVIAWPEDSVTVKPSCALEGQLAGTTFFKTEPMHCHTETSTIRRQCYGGEQLSLIANGFDPSEVRAFRLMYAALLGAGGDVASGRVDALLSGLCLRDLQRLDEGGLLVNMPARLPKEAAGSVGKGNAVSLSVSGVGAVDDMQRMDEFYRKQLWHSRRHSSISSEAERRRALFGDEAIGEGCAIGDAATYDVREDFERTLLNQQALAKGQVHGRSTPDTVITSEDGIGGGQAMCYAIDKVVMADGDIESLSGFTLPLIHRLLEVVPRSPVSIGELGRVLGVPPEPLYWSLRSIARLSSQLGDRGIVKAASLEIQVTFDQLDALVWVWS